MRLARYAGQAGAPGAPDDDPQRRAVSPAWAPAGSEAETAFSDGYPFLLANAASLEDLNSQLAAKGEATLPINRFRPNFVVAGAQPWQEDAWAALRIGSGEGGVAFDNVKPCDRCKVGCSRPGSRLRTGGARECCRAAAGLGKCVTPCPDLVACWNEPAARRLPAPGDHDQSGHGRGGHGAAGDAARAALGGRPGLGGAAPGGRVLCHQPGGAAAWRGAAGGRGRGHGAA